MELELYFEGLGASMADAVGELSIRDLALADGPGDQVDPVRFGPFRVSTERPSVTATVDLPAAPDAYEPGLVVRVRARTGDDQTIEFLNTTATPLPDGPPGPVRVVLSRIT